MLFRSAISYADKPSLVFFALQAVNVSAINEISIANNNPFLFFISAPLNRSIYFITRAELVLSQILTIRIKNEILFDATFYLKRIIFIQS